MNQQLDAAVDLARTIESFLGRKHACPCCEFRTLDARGDYQICVICFWEDDGDWDLDDDVMRGGPNHGHTLREGRTTFALYGACELPMVCHVRAPKPYEIYERTERLRALDAVARVATTGHEPTPRDEESSCSPATVTVISHAPALLQRAQDWQQARAAANTPTPDETYLLVADLLRALEASTPSPYGCSCSCHQDGNLCEECCDGAPSSPPAGWQNMKQAIEAFIDATEDYRIHSELLVSVPKKTIRMLEARNRLRELIAIPLPPESK